MAHARRVTLSVTIGGHDATAYVAPSLLDFSYVDNASGKADEVSLTLHDREGVWHGAWRPHKGTPVEASIAVTGWDGADDASAAQLRCGSFTVDEVEFSGPPDVVSIKAVSASLVGGVRDTARTQAWEGYTLRGMADEIAGRNGLALYYQGEDILFARKDQREESDLAFVQRLAESTGMHCKVHDGKLVLFDAASADATDAGLVIQRRGSMLTPTSYTFRDASSDTGYTEARVDYADPTSGTTHTVTVEAGENADAVADKDDGGKTLALNQRVESASEAIRLGKAALRKKNGKKSTASLTLMGNVALVAGITVTLSGFGEFDGAYFVESATHRVSGSGGYETSVELRGTLGY